MVSPPFLGFGSEQTFNGHLVPTPTPFPRCDVFTTSSSIMDEPSWWMGSVSTSIRVSETIYLHALTDV